jgi:hypothetical protein
VDTVTADSPAIFVLARIREDEARARAGRPDWNSDDYEGLARQEQQFNEQWHTSHCGYRIWEFSDDCVCDVPARVLAECAAKRLIWAEHAMWAVDSSSVWAGAAPYCLTCDRPGRAVSWPCPTMRALALPYAGHKDYRPEWKP